MGWFTVKYGTMRERREERTYQCTRVSPYMHQREITPTHLIAHER